MKRFFVTLVLCLISAPTFGAAVAPETPKLTLTALHRMERAHISIKGTIPLVKKFKTDLLLKRPDLLSDSSAPVDGALKYVGVVILQDASQKQTSVSVYASSENSENEETDELQVGDYVIKAKKTDTGDFFAVAQNKIRALLFAMFADGRNELYGHLKKDKCDHQEPPCDECAVVFDQLIATFFDVTE